MKMGGWLVLCALSLSACVEEGAPDPSVVTDTSLKGASAAAAGTSEVTFAIPDEFMTTGTTLTVEYAKDPDQPSADCKTGVAANQKVLSGLEPDTTYNFRACLKNPASAVMRTKTFQVRTFAPDAKEVTGLTIESAPGLPNSRLLSWQASEDAEGYRVVWADGDTAPVNCNSATAKTTIDLKDIQTKVDLGKPGHFAFRVCAAKAHSAYGYSPGATLRLTIAFPRLPAVQNFAAQTASDGRSVLLTWDAQTYAKDYVIEYYLPSSGLGFLMTEYLGTNRFSAYIGRVTTTDTHLNVTGLSPRSIYQFSIRPRAPDDTSMRSSSDLAAISVTERGKVDAPVGSVETYDGAKPAAGVIAWFNATASGGIVVFAHQPIPISNHTYYEYECPSWPANSSPQFSVVYGGSPPTVLAALPLASLANGISGPGGGITISSQLALTQVYQQARPYRITACAYGDTFSSTSLPYSPQRYSTAKTVFEIMPGMTNGDIPFQITQQPKTTWVDLQ